MAKKDRPKREKKKPKKAEHRKRGPKLPVAAKEENPPEAAKSE